MGIKRPTIHRIGDYDLAWMKARINFRQSNDRAVTIRPGCNNVTSQSLPSQFTAQRHAHFQFCKQISEANACVFLIRVRMRIVN